MAIHCNVSHIILETGETLFTNLNSIFKDEVTVIQREVKRFIQGNICLT